VFLGAPVVKDLAAAPSPPPPAAAVAGGDGGERCSRHRSGVVVPVHRRSGAHERRTGRLMRTPGGGVLLPVRAAAFVDATESAVF
jgi:hypothetical protein